MIVSYETLRSLNDELAGCEVGLLLADEGHRLKNPGEYTHRGSCSISIDLISNRALCICSICRIPNVCRPQLHPMHPTSHPYWYSCPSKSLVAFCLPCITQSYLLT